MSVKINTGLTNVVQALDSNEIARILRNINGVRYVTSMPETAVNGDTVIYCGPTTTAYVAGNTYVSNGTSWVLKNDIAPSTIDCLSSKHGELIPSAKQVLVNGLLASISVNTTSKGYIRIHGHVVSGNTESSINYGEWYLTASVSGRSISQFICNASSNNTTPEDLAEWYLCAKMTSISNGAKIDIYGQLPSITQNSGITIVVDTITGVTAQYSVGEVSLEYYTVNCRNVTTAMTELNERNGYTICITRETIYNGRTYSALTAGHSQVKDTTYKTSGNLNSTEFVEVGATFGLKGSFTNTPLGSASSTFTGIMRVDGLMDDTIRMQTVWSDSNMWSRTVSYKSGKWTYSEWNVMNAGIDISGTADKAKKVLNSISFGKIKPDSTISSELTFDGSLAKTVSTDTIGAANARGASFNITSYQSAYPYFELASCTVSSYEPECGVFRMSCYTTNDAWHVVFTIKHYSNTPKIVILYTNNITTTNADSSVILTYSSGTNRTYKIYAKPILSTACNITLEPVSAYRNNGTVFTSGQVHWTYNIKSGAASSIGSSAVANTVASKPLINFFSASYINQGSNHVLDTSSNLDARNLINTAPTSVYSNIYPSSFAWTNGNTSGPTGTLGLTNGNGKSVNSLTLGAIPSASKAVSGVVTTAAQEFSGQKTFHGKIVAKSGIDGTASHAKAITSNDSNYSVTLTKNGSNLNFSCTGYNVCVNHATSAGSVTNSFIINNTTYNGSQQKTLSLVGNNINDASTQTGLLALAYGYEQNIGQLAYSTKNNILMLSCRDSNITRAALICDSEFVVAKINGSTLTKMDSYKPVSKNKTASVVYKSSLKADGTSSFTLFGSGGLPEPTMWADDKKYYINKPTTNTNSWVAKAYPILDSDGARISLNVKQNSLLMLTLNTNRTSSTYDVNETQLCRNFKVAITETSNPGRIWFMGAFHGVAEEYHAASGTNYIAGPGGQTSYQINVLFTADATVNIRLLGNYSFPLNNIPANCVHTNLTCNLSYVIISDMIPG